MRNGKDFMINFMKLIKGLEFTKEQADQMISEIKARTRLPREES